MHRKIAGLLVLLLASAPALAQHGGTQSEQDACTPDVFRLCQDLIPDEGQIVACLKAKRPQLSVACGSVMFPPSATAATPPADSGGAPRKIRHKRKRNKAKPVA